ncbi:MAG: hypothetical protein ABSA97_11130 [Verrucomicrobiia bacterium]
MAKKQKKPPMMQTQGVQFQPFFLPGHCRSLFSTGDPIYARESPGKPFSFYELACGIARQHKERGEPIDEDTRQWIEVPDWNDERERQEIQEFLRPNDDGMGPARLAVRVQVNCSQAAAHALGSMAAECLRQLQVAADLTCESKLTSLYASVAVEELARVIAVACSELNELARKHPEIFHRFTRKGYWKWPVMKSTYPEFGDNEDELLKKLQLAKDLPLRLDPRAQWARSIKDDAGRFAWSLLWYVWRARSENNRWGFDFGDVGKMVDELPPLNKRSAPKWWGVAKTALLYTYPNPEQVDELKGIVTAPSKRRSPGRIKQAIFDILEKRFLSYAKKCPSTPRSRTKARKCACGNPAIAPSAAGWVCKRCRDMEAGNNI